MEPIPLLDVALARQTKERTFHNIRLESLPYVLKGIITQRTIENRKEPLRLLCGSLRFLMVLCVAT